MADDRSPADTEPLSGDQAQDFPPKGRQSFVHVRRDLSDEELKSPGVQKMLLDDVERLEREVSELKSFRNRYYDESTKCAVLGEKRRYSNAIEVIHVACVAIGSALIVAVPTIWTTQPAAGILLGAGIVLLLAALIAKWVQR